MAARPYGHRRRLIGLALAASAVLLLVAAPGAMADVFTPESGGSPNADSIDTLYKIVFFMALPIFLLVEGALIYTLVKYRARRGGPPAEQIRGNTPLELGWTAGAALIVAIIAVITFLFLGGIKNPSGSSKGGLASGVAVASLDQAKPPQDRKTLTIDVNGQQYLWRYDYPGQEIYSYHKLVVPTGTTVVLNLHASDVQHSWWIPKLGGKADAVPGHENHTWFKITKPGTYAGQCAELCGEGHADMRAVVEAVTPERYTAFVERQKQLIKNAQSALAEQRRQGEGQE